MPFKDEERKPAEFVRRRTKETILSFILEPKLNEHIAHTFTFKQRLLMKLEGKSYYLNY
jgi:hypothetical protein